MGDARCEDLRHSSSSTMNSINFYCIWLKLLFHAAQGAESGPARTLFFWPLERKVGDVIAFKPGKNGAHPRPPLSRPAKIVGFPGGRRVPLNYGSKVSGKRAPDLENSARHKRCWWKFSISFGPLWARVVASLHGARLRGAKLRAAMSRPAPAVQPSQPQLESICGALYLSHGVLAKSIPAKGFAGVATDQ